MSKKDELISKLIPSLKYQIKEIKESYDAMDEVSWNDQQGVIITGSEAELFVKLIESTQQTSQSSEVIPSDEEIEKASKKYHDIHGGYHPDFANGAKWFKSQLKQLNK